MRMRKMSGFAVAALILLCGVPAGAQAAKVTTTLAWAPCTDDAAFDCATANLPRDYVNAGPKSGDGVTYSVFVRRLKTTDPAHRLGTLFINPGGPGASGADFLLNASSLFSTLRTRYDIVGFDPRGTGSDQNPIDCKVNQETQGLYSVPFPTLDNFEQFFTRERAYGKRCAQLNPTAPYDTTANVVRDLDRLRGLVGDPKLNYLGFSYGTYIGATYAHLFPGKMGRVVLDGPVDADAYANDPLGGLSAQTAGFEKALDRFMTACALDQATCQGFGGSDPLEAFDQLVADADAAPIPATGFTDDPRPVTGEDIETAVLYNLYAKQYWPYIAQELAAAAHGDGSYIRADTDGYYGNNFDGTFAPDSDRYFVLGAIDERFPASKATVVAEGRRAVGTFDHFSSNAGYTGFAYMGYPSLPDQAFYGPFTVPNTAATPLVVATTYDPATPYAGAKNLVHDLHNARLLTMVGDGHTAYGGNSACIDAAVEGFLIGGNLPPAGTRCHQEVPFAPLAVAPAITAGKKVKKGFHQLHTKPVP